MARLRRKREISIFNMSALDLFASAMGAFIVLTVILFPFYLKHKDLSEQVKKAERRLGDCVRKNGELRNKIAEAGRKNSRIKAGLRGCRQKLTKTFLVIVMKWETSAHDIDMHVTDPDGHTFTYKIHNRNRTHFPGTAARLSVDTRRGPGVEIWEHPAAKPGDYRVRYHFFSKHGNRQGTLVKANVYSRDGVTRMRNVRLVREREFRRAATIRVHPGGRVTVR